MVSRFNGEITQRLLDGALEALEEPASRKTITVMPVPGAFELPLAAMALAKTRRFSCVIALGCVIRGETPHFEYVAAEAASGLQLAALETGVPVAFGVLTCDTLEQALAAGRSSAEAARSALEIRVARPAAGDDDRALLGASWQAPATLPRPCPRFAPFAARSPSFGNSRSHSMVATKRRFGRTSSGCACCSLEGRPPRLRLHALPEGRQGQRAI